MLQAVFRLVERGGVQAASLRKVAEESGVNIGSVRHYFGSHEELLLAAADEVGARMERRLRSAVPASTEARSAAPERRAFLHAVVSALLPTAPKDRAELVVLMEFITAARTRPEFRPVAARMGADMRDVLRGALRDARVPDSVVETERLVALVDGLTFELVYPHGSAADTDPSTVIHRHIDALVP